MRMLLVCIALAIAAGAAALYFGASGNAVLVAALVVCCGGMLFGMRRENGHSEPRSQHMDMPNNTRRGLRR